MLIKAFPQNVHIIIRNVVSMEITKAKLFWKIEDQTEEIIAIPYIDDVEYYTKEKLDAGYRQVAITTDVMLRLIQKIVANRFNVFEMQTEDDDELNTEIIDSLDRVSKNPAYLSELMPLQIPWLNAPQPRYNGLDSKGGRETMLRLWDSSSLMVLWE